MSKYSNVVRYEKDCTERCKSNDHGSCITFAITKRSITDKQLASFIKSVCNNFTQVVDYEGRNALHMAAACGRKELCQWLVRYAQADINARDAECGFTALHRSIFYGHLHVAIAMMKLGANGHVMDKDDLQPSDHAMKDRAGGNSYTAHNPCQLYVWGTNTNYTLGTGNQHSRPQPDLLEHFRKNNISFKQAAMNKFHSVFVSDTGRAWACGHGQGGRLGLDTEKTILKPQPLKTGTEVVVAASVGRDHTILLMENGSVWTCGLNTYHVLGHSPPPASLLIPRPLNPKVLKALGGPIIGVCAARYHSVFWSKSAVLTCGLHSGQLGHPASPDTTITVPKQVTGLAHKQCHITHVAVSDGATVVAVKKGDVYVLHQYQTRKIASRQLGVVKLAIVGGQLNSKLDAKLIDKGGYELQALALMNSGNLLFWQESIPHFIRCVVPFHHGLVFKEITLSRTNMMLVTEDGEAYQATVKPKNKKKQSISPAKKPTTDSVEKEDFYHLKMTRLPNVHRAVCVATDPKGQNFAVIQAHPKADLTDIPVLGESELAQHLCTLLEEAHEDDTLHDIVFQIGVRKFPAHRYVLALSSEDLASMKMDIMLDAIDLPNVDANIFQQILLFMYTGDCDLLHPGPCTIQMEQGDVIKTAIELCKKFAVTNLLKRLQALRYEDGMILLRESRELEAWVPPKLDRKLRPEFYDTKIASNDGAIFRAHRCILAARLEYFHSMFGGGWIESEAMSSLSLPLPQTVLREILDFLYLDESPGLIECEDVDYISSVLIVADQMFILRLKEICEVALSGALSLRNAAYILQLSSTCNAEQLKRCCMQFVCLNLPAMLESRTLEVVDTNVIEELSAYYKMMIPAMRKRVITPYSTAASDEDIVAVADAAPVVPWLCEEGDTEEEPKILMKSSSKSSSTAGKLGKKKAPRVRKSSNTEVQRRRYESVSSNSDLDTSTELQSHRVSFEEFEEHTQQEWTTVDNKMKSILQSRLKAIVMAPSILPPQEDFTKLVPLSKIIEKDVYPDLILEDVNEFPQLSDNCIHQQKEGGSNTAKKSTNMNSGEVKRSPPMKLSQKQRKKLAAEGKSDEILSKSQSPPTRAWAVLNNPEYSFVDILKQTKFGSPSSETSHTKAMETVITPNFSDIIADELQQRDNLTKMKTKSLQLTQLEDKAMEDLLSFYNASNVFDERITVQRVLNTNIAKPTWITTRRH